MPSTFFLKALGLNTSPNNLETPEGSLSEASNIIIKRDNIVESRRGLKLYGDALPSSTDRVKQILAYKNRLIRHFQTTLQFESDTSNGEFQSFSGNYEEPVAGLRMRSIVANGNFYFTSSEGIKKLSALNANTLGSSTITNAGGVKALDADAELIIELGNQTGFLPADSAVAYRIVWGLRDANNNLILGTPSSRTIVYNYLLDLVLRDLNRVLGALDDINQVGSLINDGDYLQTLQLDLSSTASDLRINLIELAQKIDEDILYADTVGVDAPLTISTSTITGTICTVNFSSGDPTNYFITGSEIFLTGFTPAGGILDGPHTVVTITSTTITFETDATGSVTVDPSATIVSYEYRSLEEPSIPSIIPTNTQLVEIQTYLSEIIQRLQSEPVSVISAPISDQYITPLDVTNSANVKLTINIPQDVTPNHFYQVYRSRTAEADGQVNLLNDITPDDELQLVFEDFPTSQQLEDGIVEVDDITPDEFRGAYLYTNSATGEGITQANDVPPFATDVNRFKNSVFYSNTKTRHRESLSLLGVQNLIDEFNAGNNPSLVITTEDVTNIYKFTLGEYETTEVEVTDGASLNASGTASYWYLNSANDENQYYIWYNIGTATDPMVANKTGIEVIATALDTADEIALKTFNQIARLNDQFGVSVSTDTLTILNIDVGYTTNASNGNTAFTITVTTEGTGERNLQEITEITTVADVAGSLGGTYFTLNTNYDFNRYYVWFKVGAFGSDPVIVGKTGIQVDLVANDSADVVAEKIKEELDTLGKFDITQVSSLLTIKVIASGEATDATAATSGFTVNITQQGALEVLIANEISSAISVDKTARSLIKVVNRNNGEIVYGYYISGTLDVPGQMLFEGRSLSDTQFYIISNNSLIGESFTPNISPEISISSISTGDPTTMLVTTSTPHGLFNLDSVIIVGTDSTPTIDGYHTITYVSPTTFRVNEYIDIAGTTGALIAPSRAESSENEEKINRVYYSKTDQPEAVPIVNYFDVGASDKAILRIFPLRDSLFVFKEDGLFRISGETTPFNLALFDSSFTLIAPDSIDVTNNIIYCWTSEGISALSESGASIISRAIDDQILKLSSSQYTNFSTLTFGVGYDSDNSYLVFTNMETSDTYATICYRYSNLTNTWTTFDIAKTAGIVNLRDDKLYLGAADINYIEQERKEFSRLDYADREIPVTIAANNFFGNVIKLPVVTGITEGDVLVQDQTLTIYTFNMLLKKLDNDPGINDTDYYSTLFAEAGDSLRSKLESLAQKLDADSGITGTDYFNTIDAKSGVITDISVASSTQITSASHGLVSNRVVAIDSSNSTPDINGTFIITRINANVFSIPETVTSAGTTGNFNTQINDFRDIEACFDAIINKLNTDIGVDYSNYSNITGNTTQEAVITNVNKATKEITLNLSLDFISGNATIYKAIPTAITYNPNVLGDPITYKQVYESAMFFINKAFTSATLSFATDLLPEYQEVDFNGDGNGIFGHITNFGDNFFGGNSNSIPFRTYVPRQCQRCRYIVIRFSHSVAREKYSIQGIALTGRPGLSSRAYR